jgi:hypothetical protein
MAPYSVAKHAGTLPMGRRQTDSDRKKLERYRFDRAHALLNCWPDGIIDDKGEEPDIVVDTTDRIYGVEITELLNESARAQEDSRRQVCEEAQKRYVALVGENGMKVNAVFDVNLQPNKAAKQEMATDLFAIVSQCLPSLPPYVFKATLRNHKDFVSKWFSSIWLHHHPDIFRGIWQPAHAWLVPRLSAEIVQERITQKEMKLQAYRKRATEVWLLIVTNGVKGSSAASIDNETFTTEYRTTFHGVVLFDEALNRVTPLRVTRSPEASRD